MVSPINSQKMEEVRVLKKVTVSRKPYKMDVQTTGMLMSLLRDMKSQNTGRDILASGGYENMSDAELDMEIQKLEGILADEDKSSREAQVGEFIPFTEGAQAEEEPEDE